MDQAAMRDYIMHERLVELGLEQTRWLDLQRYDMLDANLASHDPEFVGFPARALLLPIPQNEIDQMNADGKIRLVQNPGY